MNFNLLWLSACFQGFSIWYKHTCFCSNNVSSLNRVGLIAMAQSIRTAHSYSASENVLVAPGDGKFQTLIKKFVIRCREIFFLYTPAAEKFFSQLVELRKGQITSFSQFFQHQPQRKCPGQQCKKRSNSSFSPAVQEC